MIIVIGKLRIFSDDDDNDVIRIATCNVLMMTVTASFSREVMTPWHNSVYRYTPRQLSAMHLKNTSHKSKSHLARHVSTRHVRHVEAMHFGCVELGEQHGSTHSKRIAWHTRHVELDWLDMTSTTGATRNLVCRVICINLWYVSYSLISCSIHIFNLFYLTEQIGFVYVRA